MLLQSERTFEDGFNGRFVVKGDWRAQDHDCRTAHEQREVMRKLYDALCMARGCGLCDRCEPMAYDAVKAAEAFLD